MLDSGWLLDEISAQTTELPADEESVGSSSTYRKQKEQLMSVVYKEGLLEG